jgi:FixJ family two-component response regulator
MSLAPLVSIVDDDVSMREAISLVLRCDGLRVETFDSAEAFLKTAWQPACACIILDVRLPGASGLELQRRLARRPAAPPVIVVSAHLDEDVEKQALAAGAIAVLHKPFTEEALVRAVRRALQRQASGPTPL